METECHGGSCCGITHVFGFHEITQDVEKSLNNVLKYFLDDYYDNENQLEGYEAYEDDWDRDPEIVKKYPLRKFSCILEACLTDEQMIKYSLILKNKGFKVVNRFLNSNSGNVVNVLHYNPAGRRKIVKAPYKW